MTSSKMVGAQIDRILFARVVSAHAIISLRNTIWVIGKSLNVSAVYDALFHKLAFAVITVV